MTATVERRRAKARVIGAISFGVVLLLALNVVAVPAILVLWASFRYPKESLYIAGTVSVAILAGTLTAMIVNDSSLRDSIGTASLGVPLGSVPLLLGSAGVGSSLGRPS